MIFDLPDSTHTADGAKAPNRNPPNFTRAGKVGHCGAFWDICGASEWLISEYWVLAASNLATARSESIEPRTIDQWQGVLGDIE